MLNKRDSITSIEDGDDRSSIINSSNSLNESSKLFHNETTGFLCNKKQFLAVCCASAGVTSGGEVFGWASSAIPDLQSKWNLTENQLAWIGSIPIFGMIFGAILSGVIGNYWGRKASIIVGNIPLLIGWIVLIFAYNPWMIYIGRLFTGFGSMMINAGAITYISEISSPVLRGRFGTMTLFMSNVGLMLAYTTGMLQRIVMTGIMIFSNILTLVVVLPMPESPRWLLIQNRKEDALRSLQWLSPSSTREDVSLEIEKLISDMSVTLEKSFEWKDLLKKGNFVPILQLLFIHFIRACMFLQAIMTYASLIFSKISIENNIFLVPIITEICKTIAIILSLFVVDKIGRKFTLITSGICMSISMIVYCVSLKFPNIGLSVGAAIMFYFSYGIGWGPAPWFLIGELLPDHLRSVCSGAISAYSRVITFIAVNLYLRIQSSLGQFGMFLLIAGICFIASLFVAIFITEPKGKTLGEIRNNYHNQ